MIGTSLQTTNTNLSDFSGRVTAMFAEACRLQRDGRLRQAEKKFDSILRLAPRHSDSLHRLGVIAALRGQHDAAIKFIRKAIAIDETVAAYYLNLAIALQESGSLETAIANYRRAIELEPAFAGAHAYLGTALEEAGLVEEAIFSYRSAINLNPDVAATAYNLGNALCRLGQWEQAAICYRRAIELKPEFVEAYFNLGNVLRRLGKLDEAISYHRWTIALKPDFVPAYTNLGSELEEVGQQLEAIKCYQTVVALQPQLASGHNNLGNALRKNGGTDNVLACFRRAIALQPDYAEAHNNLGNFLQELGQLDEAYTAYERAVELAPRRATFHRMLANTGRVALESKAMQRMEELAVDIASLPTTDQIELHFALATVYTGAAQHARAFNHLLAGNRLKRDETNYNEADALALFDHIQLIFTPTHLDVGPGLGEASRLPIFVVGMPRSGTTLVEQILASHPQVHGAGELPHLPHLVGGLAPTHVGSAMPETLDEIADDAWKRLGAGYIESLRKTSPDALRIVDKLPGNFLRIGIIRLALPNARIIHVQRDPIDTCLSCFSILFTGHQPYTYDLAELGRFYRGYQNVMAHWRRVLPQSAMLEVQYEMLVSDFENQAKRIFAYCDLPWHENCLAFHKTSRLVQTASVTQVRRPLYKSSVGRWQVYREMAVPLIDALGD